MFELSDSESRERRRVVGSRSKVGRKSVDWRPVGGGRVRIRERLESHFLAKMILEKQVGYFLAKTAFKIS